MDSEGTAKKSLEGKPEGWRGEKKKDLDTEGWKMSNWI